MEIPTVRTQPSRISLKIGLDPNERVGPTLHIDMHVIRLYKLGHRDLISTRRSYFINTAAFVTGIKRKHLDSKPTFADSRPLRQDGARKSDYRKSHALVSRCMNTRRNLKSMGREIRTVFSCGRGTKRRLEHPTFHRHFGMRFDRWYI